MDQLSHTMITYLKISHLEWSWLSSSSSLAFHFVLPKHVELSLTAFPPLTNPYLDLSLHPSISTSHTNIPHITVFLKSVSAVVHILLHHANIWILGKSALFWWRSRRFLSQYCPPPHPPDDDCYAGEEWERNCACGPSFLPSLFPFSHHDSIILLLFLRLFFTGVPHGNQWKTVLSRNALSGNFYHHSSALICKFHQYCNQPPRPTNVNNVTSHECKWDEWGGHCAAGHPWGPVRPQSHSRSQSSLSFVPQLSPANLCRHNTPCFCFRISRAGNYTLGHSLSRYVLFCSLLEGPVTNWAAQ